MFPLYLKILALNICVSNLVVLMVAVASDGALRIADLIFPAAIQFLVVSMIFIVLDLLRPHKGQAERGAGQAHAESATTKPEPRDLRASRFGGAGFATRQNSAKG